MDPPEPVKFCESKSAPSSWRQKCIVSGCKNKKSGNSHITLHSFPAPKKSVVCLTDHFGNKKEIDRLDAWKLVLKVDSLKKKSRVCSLHFTKNDYYFPG